MNFPSRLTPSSSLGRFTWAWIARLSPTFLPYYQFAFFTFNEFHLIRMVAHNTPEVVEFVAAQRG
jgi:hypothetical protein